MWHIRNDTKVMSCSTARKGAILTLKAVETQGNGNVLLAVKTVEPQGKGAVLLAVKTVETQGKGTVLHRR